jgi:hypothetical protein
VAELWTPGAAGPLDQFVDRLYRRVGEFARAHGLEEASVEVELGDGALLPVKTISAEPGFGFVTLSPHGEEPEELVVPIGYIRQIRIAAPEPARERFGFSVTA